MRVFVCLLAFALFSPDAIAAARHKKRADPGLEVMIGQMIMTGFRGTGEKGADEGQASDLPVIIEDIRSGRVGGIILFDVDFQSKSEMRNIVSLDQVKGLCAMLQKEAPNPLFIGIDQEGGRVRRLKERHGAPYSPSAKELGQGGVDAVFDAAAKTGNMLRACGINLDFAPSLDVDLNPRSPAIGALDRSFSGDPQKVGRYGLAFARGLASAGVIACYKHFPGHGSAADDTHLGIADISSTWSEAELAPYRMVLKNSPPAMVMPGHIMHRALGEDVPASLSSGIISGLLRKKLGWKGVVITDDLQMGAVESMYSQKEAIRLAVSAGADILLFGNNLRHDPFEARKAHAALLALVREKAISEARIRESYRRITALKAFCF